MNGRTRATVAVRCDPAAKALPDGDPEGYAATGAAAARPASTTATRNQHQPTKAITEAQLAAIWRGRRFPAGALVTRQGVSVTVIYHGREGRGAGPDFRGAVIAGPSALPVRGDVELHVRASSFRAHGHHRDPAYAGVVLHVVFEDDVGADTPLPGGRSAPVVALAPWVSVRAGELERWLAQPLLWREPCHDAVVRMGAAGVAGALDGEGDRRFAEKTARIAARIAEAGIEQSLYEGMLEALGYGGNAAPMLALARLLPWRMLSGNLGAFGAGDNFRFEALLLGSAGMLPSQRGHDGPLDRYVVALEREFRRSGLPSLSPSLWKVWGVRPENMPARRIAGAAAMLECLGSPSTALAIAGASTIGDTVAPLIVRASGYWLTHHDVCAGPCRLPPAFVGRSRALEMAINVVLPAAAASADPGVALRARALFAALPRPAPYGQTRFIEAALASDGIRVPINARRAQGLLALNRDWCTQGGCGRCVLSMSSVQPHEVFQRSLHHDPAEELRPAVPGQVDTSPAPRRALLRGDRIRNRRNLSRG